MRKNKKIILSAILLALLIILSRFLSVKTPILKISFSFVPTMLCAIWLGPKWTVLVNVLGDLIGATLFPSGAFFIGYTILSDEILLADKTLILDNGEIVAEIQKKELINKSDVLKKYGIKLPTLLNILIQLKNEGIELPIKDFSTTELTTAIKEYLHAGGNV